jgi:hypothetical protein
LQNREWFRFHTEFKTLVEQYTAKALQIEILFMMFHSFYTSVCRTMEKISDIDITQQLSDADTRRGVMLRSLSDAVKPFINHSDTTKRNAAQCLQTVFDRYKNALHKSHDENTATIHQLLRELNNSYAKDIITIGISGRVAQLEADNEAFEDLQISRYTDDDAQRVDIYLEQTRKNTDNIYHDILERVDAAILLVAEQPFAAFIRDLNAQVEQFKRIEN